MDIDELMELPVIMPSRKLERQFDATAAIYVITREDIRRSGARRISELLRRVPGIHVGTLDNNTWAVSSRSDMTRFSNSMLVLLDGRTLYNPLFGGVYWDVQDTFLQDIDRIEIIRGPGASLWGANAVNGIINIITKSADKTAYTSAYAGVGQGSQLYDGGVRFGGKINDSTIGRVYVKAFKTDQGEYLDSTKSPNAGFFPVGDDAHDDEKNTQAGFLVERTINKKSILTFQGDRYRADINNIRTAVQRENAVESSGYNFIVKWKKSFSNISDMMVQFYLDHTEREDLTFEEMRDIYDFDIQHTLQLQSNTFTWGLGMRRTKDETNRTPAGTFELDPSALSDTVLSAFFQDEIQIIDNKLMVTIGTKFEENDFTGGEIQPTARVRWKIDLQQTMWSAITRSVRIPTRSDLHAQLNFGGPPISISDPNSKSESVVATELGYRGKLNSNALIDIALFNHNYSDPNPDATQLDRSYGLETVVKYDFNSDWRTETSYTWHKGTVIFNGDRIADQRLPRNTLHFRALYNISFEWELDTFITYKEAQTTDTYDYENYIRLDIRLGWSPHRNSRFSLSMANITDDKHAEVTDSTRINTAVGRSVFLSAAYDFR